MGNRVQGSETKAKADAEAKAEAKARAKEYADVEGDTLGSPKPSRRTELIIQGGHQHLPFKDPRTKT